MQQYMCIYPKLLVIIAHLQSVGYIVVAEEYPSRTPPTPMNGIWGNFHRIFITYFHWAPSMKSLLRFHIERTWLFSFMYMAIRGTNRLYITLLTPLNRSTDLCLRFGSDWFLCLTLTMVFIINWHGGIHLLSVIPTH